jgi:hemolysin activation/secretion protein
VKHFPLTFLALSVTHLAALAQPIDRIARIDLGEAPIPQSHQLEYSLASFLNQESTEQTVAAIGDVIVRHYQANGQPVVLVSIAPEVSDTGVLSVTIEEGRVGQSAVTGGKHLNTKSWQRAAEAMQGKPLDGIATQSLLDTIQRNPFAANATLSAAPGASATEANLQFQVPNTSSWQASLGYANDGVPPLGSNRWRVAAITGNAFGSGTRVGAEVTMGDDTKSYLAETLTLTIPLPWLHELSLSAAHASTEVSITDHGETVDVGGDAWLGSLRYTIPWRSSLSWKHSVYLGADYKHFDTDLTFGGLGTFSQPLETSAVVLGGSSAYQQGALTAGGMLEAAWSPGGLFSHDGTEDYESIVEGADSQFLIIRSGLWTRWELPHAWTLQGRVSGQWADGPLLPSEEASITGMSAVRGYEERSVRGNLAVWGAVEIFSPPFVHPFCRQKACRIVTFADAGKAWASEAEEPNESALAAGCGLHVALKHCQLRCEVAWPLHELGHEHDDQSNGPRLHVAASISF